MPRSLRPLRRWQSAVLLGLGGLVLEPFLSDSLSAQTTESELGTLVDRIGQVEHDIKDVERHIYTGNGEIVVAANGTSDAPSDTPNDQTSARLIERVDGLEQEVRDLTGQVEELGNRLGQLQTQFDQFSGKSGSATGASPPQPQSGATTSPSGSGAPTSPTDLSGNSAQGSGLAPGETTLGQVPAGQVAPQPSIEDQYNSALGYLRQQDYTSAESALKAFIAQHPKDDLTGPAMYWLGETYFVQNDFPNAAQTFLDAIKKYPSSPKAPDSMLKLGMSLASLGQKTQACASFRELPKKYPKASQTILQRAKVESQRAACPK